MQYESTVLPPSIVVSQQTVYATQGNIHALEASSGLLQQVYHIQGLAYPTVANDVIYLNKNYESNHTVQALQVSDGLPLWQFEVEGYLSSSPVVSEHALYISSTSTVYALQTDDGSLLWRYETGPMHFAPPTVLGEGVYVSPSVNRPLQPSVYALDASTGLLRWQSQVPASSPLPLTAVDDVVYISSHDGCSALQANDGSLIWRQKIEGQPWSSPIVVDETVYITFSLMKQDFSLEPGQVRPELYIKALRKNDGMLLWQHQLGTTTDATSSTAPVVSQGKLFVGTDDGYLSALKASDGTLAWHYKTGGSRLSPPAVVDGTICIGANDGYIYALSSDNGSLLWHTFVSTSVTVTTSGSVWSIPNDE